MTRSRKRFVLACLVSPLVAPLLAPIMILLFSEDVHGNSPNFEYTLNQLLELLAIEGMFLILGVPIAYAVTIFLGVPFYFLARRLEFINFWTVTSGAAIVAVLPFLILVAQNSLAFFAAIALIGYVVGLTFWFISGLYQRQHEPSGSD